MAAQAPSGERDALDPELVPILGEFAWHSLTLDSRLVEVSEEHYALVARLLARTGRRTPLDSRVLEVAAYAHITGYLLYQRLGARTDLLDISPSTLRLGRRLARERGLPTEGTTCVAGDFHHLPYADGEFDLVCICSALHHTWLWPQVLGEMLRVLAPGGMLLLENEPCRRRFCHYLFRANRAEQGELERALDKLGILRTVAEPFPGTRPESLFGMVENQTIPIEALCGMLAAGCSPVEVTVTPEVCMGELEHAMVAHRRDPKGACARWLTGEMMRRVDAARAAISEADRGMGFALPSPAQIEELCASTAAALAGLPADSSSPDFRIGLADIFGASVRIAVRKNGPLRGMRDARPWRQYSLSDGIAYAFPERIARLLDPGSAAMPDIQSAPIAALEATFPPSDWTSSVSEAGLRALVPVTAQPSFGVDIARPGPLLIVVRLHVVVDGRPFRVMLCTGEEELAGFDAYRTDSLLLRPILHCPPSASRLRLSIRTRSLDGADGDQAPRVFNVAYAGAFALEAADRGEALSASAGA
ncbi:MAG TPA: class I SAM-dependent methyltransferase [Casimicrobiaceae bacterium]|nr:class I SAM-dependent methyltransferase [Casimicrobiaceae bacterium]